MVRELTEQKRILVGRKRSHFLMISSILASQVKLIRAFKVTWKVLTGEYGNEEEEREEREEGDDEMPLGQGNEEEHTDEVEGDNKDEGP